MKHKDLQHSHLISGAKDQKPSLAESRVSMMSAIRLELSAGDEKALTPDPHVGNWSTARWVEHDPCPQVKPEVWLPYLDTQIVEEEARTLAHQEGCRHALGFRVRRLVVGAGNNFTNPVPRNGLSRRERRAGSSPRYRDASNSMLALP